MLTLKYTARFKKDYKLAKKRGLDISLLEYIINELANQRQLEQNIKTTLFQAIIPASAHVISNRIGYLCIWLKIMCLL